MVDTSFCIRLLKKDDEYHQNAVEYFEYFLENRIDIFLSTIVVAEYAVGDDPDNLLTLNTFRLLEFDYQDAKISGYFTNELLKLKPLRDIELRKVVINDVKLFAQIKNRKIDAYITKDRLSLSKMIEHLNQSHLLRFEFIDLAVPLNDKLGRLF